MLSICLLALFVGVAYAGSNQSIVQGTTNRTIYKEGNNVDISGIVNGDIYCAGQSVNIDAQVNGDVICAAQTITINGKVSGNVRVVGQTVNLGASVTKNVSIAGQTVVLQNNSFVEQDVLVAGQTVSMNGTIGRDVTVAANSVTIRSSIGRNVNAKVGNELMLTSNAKVGGNIDYTSPRMWDKSTGAEVAGTVAFHKSKPSHRGSAGLNIIWNVYSLVAITVFAVVLVALFPQLFRKWSVTSKQNIGYVLLTGFVAMLALPVVILLSFVTVIGAPLGILLLLLWVTTALLSIPFASYIVGTKVVPKWHPILAVLVGSLVLGVVGLVPFIGWLVSFLAYLLGTGTILWNLKRSYKKPNYGPTV